MLLTQGATFLMMKTADKIFIRVKKIAIWMPLFTIALFALGGYMIQGLYGYEITSISGTELTSNPFNKSVDYKAGAWLLNYTKFPWIKVAPILGFVASIAVVVFASFRHAAFAFISSSLAVIGIMSTVGLSMFPFILPSNLNYTASLTVWDASSSYRALVVMLGVVVIFVPIILAYVSVANKIMFGKITEDEINKHDKMSY